MATIEDYINGLKDDATVLAKEEFLDWIRGSKDEPDAFVRNQRAKMERYLAQLANGEITGEEFKQYVVDLRSLIELEMLMQSVATKAKAQDFVAKLQDLVLKRLVSLL